MHAQCMSRFAHKTHVPHKYARCINTYPVAVSLFALQGVFVIVLTSQHWDSLALGSQKAASSLQGPHLAWMDARPAWATGPEVAKE